VTAAGDANAFTVVTMHDPQSPFDTVPTLYNGLASSLTP
jgi:hypothetical protein